MKPTPLRDLIAAEPDVRAVHELEPIAGTDDWRYFLETTFASWPRYVIGRIDATGASSAIEYRCGHIDAARAHWHKIQ